MLPERESRPAANGTARESLDIDSPTVPVRADINGDALGAYIEHFRSRVLQDALNEATAAYWKRRAATFARVGTPACDEIAAACRARAAVSLGGELR